MPPLRIARSVVSSIRVAPGQDPKRCTDLLRRHLEANVPWGLEVTFVPDDCVPAWSCEPEGWAFDAAERLGTTVIGFVRDERFNVYTHAERVSG